VDAERLRSKRSKQRPKRIGMRRITVMPITTMGMIIMITIIIITTMITPIPIITHMIMSMQSPRPKRIGTAIIFTMARGSRACMRRA
jgi:hypothetical protein